MFDRDIKIAEKILVEIKKGNEERIKNSKVELQVLEKEYKQRKAEHNVSERIFKYLILEIFKTENIHIKNDIFIVTVKKNKVDDLLKEIINKSKNKRERSYAEYRRNLYMDDKINKETVWCVDNKEYKITIELV
ncbi:MAG: hypothetical protein ACOC1K_07675 [Nanoarchaeota archaeon]